MARRRNSWSTTALQSGSGLAASLRQSLPEGRKRPQRQQVIGRVDSRQPDGSSPRRKKGLGLVQSSPDLRRGQVTGRTRAVHPWKATPWACAAATGGFKASRHGWQAADIAWDAPVGHARADAAAEATRTAQGLILPPKRRHQLDESAPPPKRGDRLAGRHGHRGGAAGSARRDSRSGSWDAQHRGVRPSAAAASPPAALFPSVDRAPKDTAAHVPCGARRWGASSTCYESTPRSRTPAGGGRIGALLIRPVSLGSLAASSAGLIGDPQLSRASGRARPHRTEARWHRPARKPGERWISRS